MWYNGGMKNLKTLFVTCAAVTVVAFLAFVNNVFAIVNWWRAFLAAGGDSSGMPERVSGLLPWLDWTAVDYSAVTTLIPCLGLVCMTRALWQLQHGVRLRAGDFPFFKGSDQLNVALGLFGTLWGIIVIGYFKLDTVSMADLMQCLHTALFSTLMAVVWVFMIDRPLVRPYFTKLLTRAGLAETDESDLADAVARLVTHLDAASAAFDRREQAFEQAFEARQARYEKAFQDRLAAFGEALAAQQKNFEAACAAREQAVGEAAEKRLVASEAAAEKRQAASDAALAQRLEELARASRQRQEAYEKDFEARQKEYVETFRRRIGELQASADEARARAEASEKRATACEAKLKAVTEAIMK